MHIDGSALPNPGRMALGAVLQTPQGMRYTLSEDTRRVGCNNEAEALALLAALKILTAHHVQYAHIYSDSSILVEQLQAPHPKPIARLSALYAHARTEAQRFTAVEMHWIPRHRNQEADALARAALQSPAAAA